MKCVAIFVTVFSLGSSIAFGEDGPWTTEESPITIPAGRYSAKPHCLAFNLISKYCLLNCPPKPCVPLTTTPCPTAYTTVSACTCRPCQTDPWFPTTEASIQTVTPTWSPTGTYSKEASIHTGTYIPTTGTPDYTASDSLPSSVGSGSGPSVSLPAESPIDS